MNQPVLLFDVIETLFSLRPLRSRFEELGLPGEAATVFFSQLLRDAFALSTAGVFHPFPKVARANLEVCLENWGQAAETERVDRVLTALSQLPPHEDVAAAFESLRAHPEVRVVLLTNGSRENTENLAHQAGIEDRVDHVISIDDLGVWKPHADVYRGAIERAGGTVGSTILIAAHAWDCLGALQAGLQAVWVRRQDTRYHSLMGQPLACVDSLPEALGEALDYFATQDGS